MANHYLSPEQLAETLQGLIYSLLLLCTSDSCDFMNFDNCAKHSGGMESALSRVWFATSIIVVR